MDSSWSCGHHSGDRRLCYKSWKNSLVFGGYRQFDSNPGWYRMASRFAWRQARSSSRLEGSWQSSQKNRSSSRAESFITNKQVVDKIDKSMKKMKMEVMVENQKN